MSVRLLRKPTPGTAFVFGGGGNLGAVQVGMLQALLEAGITPDLVIGCSVGALNAAGLAADATLDGVRTMRQTWLHLNGDELFPAGRISGLWTLGRKGQAIQPNTGLRHLIERTIPFRRLEDAPIPVDVVATSLVTGRGRWFSTGSVQGRHPRLGGVAGDPHRAASAHRTRPAQSPARARSAAAALFSSCVSSATPSLWPAESCSAASAALDLSRACLRGTSAS